MNRKTVVFSIPIVFLLTVLLTTSVIAAPMWQRNPKAFEHGIKLEIDGEYYYFAGMPIPDPDGNYKQDIPGHTWVQTGPYRVVGRHYNYPSYPMHPDIPFWAIYEPENVMLYKVDGIVDMPPTELSEKKENWLKDHGYVHKHELVYADNGSVAGELVVYLKHTAIRSFYFTPPMAPWNWHWVTPGIDDNFMPNW